LIDLCNWLNAKSQNETRFKDILALFSRHGIVYRGKSYEEDSKNQMINITPVVRLIVTRSLPKGN